MWGFLVPCIYICVYIYICIHRYYMCHTYAGLPVQVYTCNYTMFIWSFVRWDAYLRGILGDPAICHRAWARQNWLVAWLDPVPGRLATPVQSHSLCLSHRWCWETPVERFSIAKLGPVTGPNLALLHQLLHILRWRVTLVSVWRSTTKDRGGIGAEEWNADVIKGILTTKNMRLWQSKIQVWPTKDEDVMMSHIINWIIRSKDRVIGPQNITKHRKIMEDRPTTKRVELVVCCPSGFRTSRNKDITTSHHGGKLESIKALT